MLARMLADAPGTSEARPATTVTLAGAGEILRASPAKKQDSGRLSGASPNGSASGYSSQPTSYSVPRPASVESSPQRLSLATRLAPADDASWTIPPLAREMATAPVLFSERPMSHLRICTWNVWFSPHRAQERMAALFSELLNEAPDLICLQEVCHGTALRGPWDPTLLTPYADVAC